jgi:hypothetical protein
VNLEDEKERLTELGQQMQQMKQQDNMIQQQMQANMQEQLVVKGRIEALASIMDT